jgi:hypothetical protein
MNMNESINDKEVKAINQCVLALNELLEDNNADAFDAFARVFSYLRQRYLSDMERRQIEKMEKIKAYIEQLPVEAKTADPKEPTQ